MNDIAPPPATEMKGKEAFLLSSMVHKACDSTKNPNNGVMISDKSDQTLICMHFPDAESWSQEE